MRATSRSSCRAHADVRVLTTCARDYVTWRNELPPGEDAVNGIPVERFPVAARARHRATSRGRSTRVFARPHSVQDELDVARQPGAGQPGPDRRGCSASPANSTSCSSSASATTTAYHGARAVAAHSAVLVPTAEREPALGLAIFQPVFRGVRAIMYNSLRGAGD